MYTTPVHMQPSSATIHQFDPATTLIRIPEMEAITGIKRATFYKLLKHDPTFPRPVPLSNSSSRGAPIGFVLAEVYAWVQKRIDLREVAA
ncbi:prophage regulatory protein [Pseudomonas sp. JUb42]|uniref:helix-turn-helix transcriptional regulator n=1 Tax=Pseudomonas sp. JUb42 TaxID=2940611 RepID=UPI002166F019|nr:AlpA family phage regulatory protein [Pseudomonas sp. JUb42]MCS3471252.1 prophage regulatory protein [Pseudomonas sp. JUb42]